MGSGPVRERTLGRGRTGVLALVAVLGLALAVTGCGAIAVTRATSTPTADAALAAAVARVRAGLESARPLDNDCAAGHVTFTFDDGPDEYTPLTMQVLEALHLRGIFFVEGKKIADSARAKAVVRTLAAHGFLVENHTFDHKSFTGQSSGTAALTDAQIAEEITSTTRQITDLGLPRPALLRPPFGDVDARSAAAVTRLGYQLVLSWSTPAGGIIDSRDWDGATPGQITRVVTLGRTHDGETYPPATDGTIIAMHDGQKQTTLSMLESLQPIVDWLNRHHLCSTDTVPADATGGVVATAGPPQQAGDLVPNGALAQFGDGASSTEPACFEQGGDDSSGSTASWRHARHGHGDASAARVDVSAWRTGDHKLVTSQRASQPECVIAAQPGRRLQMWASYRGSWPTTGTTPSRVSLVAYYRTGADSWHYWTESALLPPSRRWATAYLATPPLPAGARAVSFGLGITGVGRLAMDDFALAQR